jgi:hypothetical protein
MKGSEMAEVRQQCSNDRSLHSTAGFAGRESTAFAFQIDCTRDVASRRRSTRDNTSDNIGSDIKVLGSECLLLEDCCGATDHGNHLAAIKMVKMQGGVFGSVSSSDELIRSLGPKRDDPGNAPGS